MSSSAMALPLRRWSRVVAPVLAGAALIAGGVFAGRATAPTPSTQPPRACATEVILGDWRYPFAASMPGGHGETRDVAPRPDGGFVILYGADVASVGTVKLIIVAPQGSPRTIVLDDIAPPQAFHCGWGGSCQYDGPALLDEDDLFVVIGPHAHRNGVLRAHISVDGGATWSARDIATDIHGRMMYSLHDGALQWYAEERQLYPERDKPPVRLHGRLRLAEPRRPETARHRPR